MRGNLNFDNFKNLGTRINKNGYFELSSNSITHAASYNFVYENKYFNLVLFKGDNLNLEFEKEDPISTLFASGTGAGKINILNLGQFNPNLYYDEKYTIEEYSYKVDSITQIQTNIINAIRSKDLNNESIQNAENKDLIVRILIENEISKEEYRFIENIILSKKYALNGFISYLGDRNKLDSAQVDFSASIFSSFNSINYGKIDNLNDFRLANALDNILYFEFLKDNHSELSYSDWNSFRSDTIFRNWIPEFIKSNYSTEVFDQYFAEPVGALQTLGYDFKDHYNFLKEECIDHKYLQRIDVFNGLVNNGLKDLDYNLGSEEHNLDKEKFDNLISSHVNKPIFLTFWSARFAGASIIPHLPAIKDFEINYKDQFGIINICIDNEANKGLWAARIIDNNWKANHYFMPIEGNDSTLTKFECNRISTFCYGGAVYSLIDKEGEVIINIEPPMTLTENKLLDYLESN